MRTSIKKIRVHIDPLGYDEKPSGKEIGGIKTRLQKSASPSLITLEELVQKIEAGHSISLGIMEGISVRDGREQPLFLVDIDNEEEGPILRIKDAKANSSSKCRNTAIHMINDEIGLFANDLTDLTPAASYRAVQH